MTTDASELIGSIYDCVLEPARWPDTLSAVRKSLKFRTASIEVLDLRTFGPIVVATSGMEEPWISRTFEYSNAEMVAQWGGPEKIMTAPTDQPVVLSTWHPEGITDAHRYYRDWARPQGIIDAVTVVLARDAISVGNLTMGRHESAGAITDDVIQGVQILLPHLQRAISISRLLEGKSVALQNFREVLDKLTVAAILVREDLSILFANDAAEQMFRAGCLMRRQNSKLELIRPMEARALASAIRNMANGIGNSASVAIAIRDLNDCPYIIRTLPITQNPHLMAAPTGIAAAIFVAPPFDDKPPSVCNAVATLYGLTAAEARVLTLLMQSNSQSAIATMTGVTRATVKGHVLNIFSKMGINRQADLVNLVRSFDLPIS